MKRSRLFSVSAAVVCAAGAATAAAEQQEQPRCALAVARVAGERATAVYDAPGGGSQIGYLAPGSKYFMAESRALDHSTRDRWHMLLAPGGAFVGWVGSWDGLDVLEAPCPRALPPIEFPLQLLYPSNR